MVWRLFIFVLLVPLAMFQQPPAAEAFQQQQLPPVRSVSFLLPSRSRLRHDANIMALPCLYLSSKNNNNNNNNEESEESEELTRAGVTSEGPQEESIAPPAASLPTSPLSSESTSTKNNSPNVLSTIFDGVSMLWGYFIILFGVTLTGGLILNLMGYGYQFSPLDGGGLKIDTLQELRMEKQLDILTDGVIPARSSQSGLMQFFIHNPFLSATIATAFVLVYEEILKSVRKK